MGEPSDRVLKASGGDISVFINKGGTISMIQPMFGEGDQLITVSLGDLPVLIEMLQEHLPGGPAHKNNVNKG